MADSGGALWRLFADYYARVPDGVVNDRWLPWSPLLAAARWEPVRRLIAAGARRSAERDGGLVPPRPPHFDVRTPEFVSFSTPQRTPWECVRGMDHSFGYNAASREADFVTRDDLLWELVDVVANGGNLLLNVGPRGTDAQIPDEQLARLGWLADWVVPHRSAIAATRPFVTPGTTTGRAGRRSATRPVTTSCSRSCVTRPSRSRSPTCEPPRRRRSRP